MFLCKPFNAKNPKKPRFFPIELLPISYTDSQRGAQQTIKWNTSGYFEKTASKLLHGVCLVIESAVRIIYSIIFLLH